MSTTIASPKVQTERRDDTGSVNTQSENVQALLVYGNKGERGVFKRYNDISDLKGTVPSDPSNTSMFVATAAASGPDNYLVAIVDDGTSTYASSEVVVTSLGLAVASGQNTALAQLALTGTRNDASEVDLTSDGDVAYVSSDTGIATVNASGAVTAVSDGTVEITATYNNITATVSVTVDAA